MRTIPDLARRWEHLVPWLILAVVGGVTLAALQILVVRLLH